MIFSPGASTKPYIQSLKVNGREVQGPILTHDQIAHGGLIEFVMSDKPEQWGSSTIFVEVGDDGEGKGVPNDVADRANHRRPHVEL